MWVRHRVYAEHLHTIQKVTLLQIGESPAISCGMSWAHFQQGAAFQRDSYYVVIVDRGTPDSADRDSFDLSLVHAVNNVADL